MLQELAELGIQIAGTLLITLIGVLGSWLMLKLGKNTHLENINAAQKEVIRAARTTVGELQQTVVDDLKASREDGKLTGEEIQELGAKLIALTMKKLSMPTYDLLKAAAVDIEAMITGAGENWINKLKGNS